MDRLVTQEQIDALTQQIAGLERQIAAIAADTRTVAQRIDRMDSAGLTTLMFRNLFRVSGGLNGTSDQAARADHTH